MESLAGVEHVCKVNMFGALLQAGPRLYLFCLSRRKPLNTAGAFDTTAKLLLHQLFATVYCL
eukprot:scaffold175055_cov21-Tisochrysis_lutea.AAC.1